MEEGRSGLRSKKEIAPKITHTKITISKSTPFLISKHHLDDTQMRNALNYDDRTVKNNHQRTYSYKGEVISCVNSKIKQRFDTFQSPSNPIPLPNQNEKHSQYYPEMQNKSVQVQEKIMKPRIYSNQEPVSKISTKKNTDERLPKNSVKIAGHFNANDYGMQEKKLIEAKKTLEKQGQKLRKLYKKSVQKSIKLTSGSKINDLEEQIKQIKIKNLQLQKQRLLNDYLRTKQLITNSPNILQDPKTDSKQRYNRMHSILNKPRFKIKHEENDETDSSFSSFELQ